MAHLFSRRRLILLVVFAVAGVAVARSGSHLGVSWRSLSQVPVPSWPWLAVAASLVAASYVAGAIALRAASGRPLPLGRTTLVQFAAAAANRITPAGAGGVAINARYLTRQGLTGTQAGTAVALTGLAHVVTATIGVLALSPSATALPGVSLLSTTVRHHPAVVAAAVFAVLAAVAVLHSPQARASRLQRAARRSLREALVSARDLARDPRRTTVLLLSTAAVKLANLLALQAALWAFDGDVSAARVAAVYLVGVTAAEAVPSPAGLGTVDAVLLAGLAGTTGTAGAAAGAAFGAVIAFRLLSYWAPIVPGVVASAMLRRRLAL